MKLRLAMALAFAAAMIGSASAETNLNGAGATFPNPIYQKWFSEYHNAHNDVKINYQSMAAAAVYSSSRQGPLILEPATAL